MDVLEVLSSSAENRTGGTEIRSVIVSRMSCSAPSSFSFSSVSPQKVTEQVRWNKLEVYQLSRLWRHVALKSCNCTWPGRSPSTQSYHFFRHTPRARFTLEWVCDTYVKSASVRKSGRWSQRKLKDAAFFQSRTIHRTVNKLGRQDRYWTKIKPKRLLHIEKVRWSRC